MDEAKPATPNTVGEIAISSAVERARHATVAAPVTIAVPIPIILPIDFFFCAEIIF